MESQEVLLTPWSAWTVIAIDVVGGCRSGPRSLPFHKDRAPECVGYGVRSPRADHGFVISEVQEKLPSLATSTSTPVLEPREVPPGLCRRCHLNLSDLKSISKPNCSHRKFKVSCTRSASVFACL